MITDSFQLGRLARSKFVESFDLAQHSDDEQGDGNHATSPYGYGIFNAKIAILLQKKQKNLQKHEKNLNLQSTQRLGKVRLNGRQNETLENTVMEKVSFRIENIDGAL